MVLEGDQLWWLAVSLIYHMVFQTCLTAGVHVSCPEAATGVQQHGPEVKNARVEVGCNRVSLTVKCLSHQVTDFRKIAESASRPAVIRLL